MRKRLLCILMLFSILISSMTVFAAERETVRIDAPTNARWEEKTGNFVFDASKNGFGHYYFSLYNAADDKQLYSYEAYFPADEVGDQISLGIPSEALELMTTGSYYFEVYAVGSNGYESSESCKSEVLDYVRPQKQVAAPYDLRWEDATGHWSLSDEAVIQYELEFKEEGGEWEWMSDRFYYRGKENKILKHSFADEINSQGTYRFRVKALSNNIFEAVDSDWSEWSPEKSSIDMAGSVGTELEALLEGNAGADELLAVLEGKSTEALAVAIQTDAKAGSMIAEAEKIFAVERGISVNAEIASDMADKINGTVSILGAAFNAGTNVKSMTLNISKPTTDKEVDKQQYKNVVQINMTLDGAADVQNLKIPVKITMPIPAGVDSNGLQILHYHNDGSYETIWPENINISGGYVSFTLTSFSTFVFANTVETEPEPTPTPDPEPTPTPDPEPTQEPTPEPSPTTEPAPDPKPTAEPTPSPSGDLPFADVKAGWRYDNIKFVYDRGIMTGFDSQSFRPDVSLTRAQFASVIYRLAGTPKVSYKAVFSDVPSGQWFSDAIIWASENDIVAGLGGGIYGPYEEITREQMARMLMGFAEWKKYDISENADLDKFTDAAQVSRWAVDHVRWAVGSGIINGSIRDGKYYLSPKGQATRAECAVMLTQFIQKYK